MSTPTELWDGRSLGQGPLALIVVPQWKEREAGREQPAVGVASDGVVTVILPPEQLGLFVEAHATATLVCYGVVGLHWCLHRYLAERGRVKAIEVLWCLSLDSHLVDVMLLDQAVRRFGGEAMPPARTLAELAAQRAGLELPADHVLVVRVADELPAALLMPDHELWEMLAQAAAAVLQVYQQLQAEADAILGVVANTNRPAILPSSSPAVQQKIRAQTKRLVESAVERMQEREQERLAESGADLDLPAVAQAEIESTAEDGQPGLDAAETAACDAVGPPAIDYGPLGIGIEVQGAIAQHQPKPRDCLVDPDELAAIREWSKRRFNEARARLRADHEARGWLPQGGTPAALDRESLSETQMKSLRVWLHKAGQRLCDVHNSPASIPLTGAKEPCYDPDAWGPWTACDPHMRAWRDLVHAARLHRWAQEGGQMCSGDAAVFRDWASPPNLLALRPITSTLFRPWVGHAFLVGRLEGLRTRCLAIVCRRRWYSGNGRRYGFILRQHNYMDAAAGELFVHYADRPHENAVTEYNTSESGSPPPVESHRRLDSANVDVASHESRVQAFSEMRHTQPELHSYWVRLTKALLEVAPLGLPAASQGVLLAQEYGIDDLNATDLLRLNGLLRQKVAYELEGFLSDDALEQVASGAGVPVGTVIDALPISQHVETNDARVRNDLLREQSSSPVRTLVAEAEREGRATDLAPSKNRARRWLHRAASTLAGRVTPPDFCAGTRRAEYLAAVEEVRMAIAYALVAAGFDLVALEGEEFVLELPEAAAGERETQERIRRVVHEAGRNLLGSLAPPCRL